jgi:RimJ/RimL family protein N-acetyltransferase
MFKLICQSCTLQDFTSEELASDAYYGWLCDYEVIKTLNLPDYVKPVPRGSVERYVEGLWANPDVIFLALYAGNPQVFVGTLKIGSINRLSGTADIGIMIGDRSFWGQGLGTKAVSLAAEFCFQRLGLRKLTAGVMSINPGMTRCFEKIGFVQEGCFREQDFYEGSFVDHVHLGCFASEYRKSH